LHRAAFAQPTESILVREKIPFGFECNLASNVVGKTSSETGLSDVAAEFVEKSQSSKLWAQLKFAFRELSVY